MALAERIDVSIIIPSYNSEEHCLECLRSLLEQNTASNYEIIVVDSSSDGTREVIKSKFPHVNLITLNKRTFPGQARNIGVKSSIGELIVFTDTDCVVKPDWLETLLRSHRKHYGYRVIGGAVINGTPKSLIGTAEYLLEFNEFSPYRQEGNARLLPTCNVSLKRDIFKEYGYFENIIKGSDTLFSRKMIDRGERVFFTPGFAVIHNNRINLSKFLLNQFELGLGSAQVRKRIKMWGTILVNAPLLIPLIPFVRLALIGRRLMKHNLNMFFLFVLHIPLIFLGLVFYTSGFLKGALEDLDSERQEYI